MFLIAGISPKIKTVGKAGGCPCLMCGAAAEFNVIHKYMTPHIFFIPTFRFHSEYTAVCPVCAGVMWLDKEKGKALERGKNAAISPEELSVCKNKYQPGG